jgi:hypothetical protein
MVSKSSSLTGSFYAEIAKSFSTDCKTDIFETFFAGDIPNLAGDSQFLAYCLKEDMNVVSGFLI